MRALVLKDDEEEALDLSSRTTRQSNRQTSHISISSDGFSDREMQEAMLASLNQPDEKGQRPQDQHDSPGSSPLSAIPLLDGSTDSKDDIMSVCSDQSPGGVELTPPSLQLSPSIHKEMELIMAPHTTQLLRLKTATPDVVPPPSIGQYLRSCTHLQLIKRRLAPLGASILEHIETIPEEKRIPRELDLCRYLVGSWPLPLHEDTHLDIQAMYRVHFYKLDMKKKARKAAAQKEREARLGLGNHIADISIVSPNNSPSNNATVQLTEMVKDS